jgi:hypothetical protein
MQVFEHLFLVQKRVLWSAYIALSYFCLEDDPGFLGGCLAF